MVSEGRAEGRDRDESSWPSFRVAAADAVPTIRDLNAVVQRPGQANDLVELAEIQPGLAEVAVGSGVPDCGDGSSDVELQRPADDDFSQGAFGEAECALWNSLPATSMLRAYTPELVGWFDDFGPSSAYVDAIGAIGRINTTFNAFSLSAPGIPNLGDALSPSEQLAALDTSNLRRCPGANEHPLGAADPDDDSVPFTDGGALTDGEPGDCDPDHVTPGP